jgi:hypothetical protein
MDVREARLLGEIDRWTSDVAALGGDSGDSALTAAQEMAKSAYRAGHSFDHSFQAGRDAFYAALNGRSGNQQLQGQPFA